MIADRLAAEQEASASVPPKAVIKAERGWVWLTGA